jgi:hypothetical protein
MQRREVAAEVVDVDRIFRRCVASVENHDRPFSANRKAEIIRVYGSRGISPSELLTFCRAFNDDDDGAGVLHRDANGHEARLQIDLSCEHFLEPKVLGRWVVAAAALAGRNAPRAHSRADAAQANPVEPGSAAAAAAIQRPETVPVDPARMALEVVPAVPASAAAPAIAAAAPAAAAPAVVPVKRGRGRPRSQARLAMEARREAELKSMRGVWQRLRESSMPRPGHAAPPAMNNSAPARRARSP